MKRNSFVANNPGTAAIFFDQIIEAFIRIVLKYNAASTSTREDGLFGRCSAYYAMVEAQGRGTLHCHMLVWIEGNPSPQELRDRMRSDPQFQGQMFAWLESIISCELPSTTSIVQEPDGPLKPPKMPDDWDDPRLHKEPCVAAMTDDEFQPAFAKTVEDLAIKSNWHVHRATCFKYLKANEPRNDTTCRMRVNGEVHAHTHLDPQTDSIILRRLHPRINCYNRLIIFLLRCNMDVKYVGSGEAAKALVHYVTDYVTKSTLATHIGLSAVEYAIKRNTEKYAGSAGEINTIDQINRSLFTKTVMALMSKQELSHQQVMSYLIGGGDCYKSHTFTNVRWGDIDRLIDQGEAALDADPSDEASSAAAPRHHSCGIAVDVADRMSEYDDDEESDAREDEVSLVITENYVGASAHLVEYPLRSQDELFENLCLWQHEEWVTKVSAAAEGRRLEKLED
ncbi:hypothetical protein K438DRAFT_1606696, partial [Mycena galopus ATCC 62051]